MALSPTPIPNSDIANGARAQAATILQLESGIAWRQYLQPAMFRGVRFYVETGTRSSARRVVPHEFPKRDVPYAEDMGRKARSFSVRGYLIVYPRDGSNELQSKNYIPQRDKLIAALETEGPANLQLPLLGILNVACQQYRVSEEDRYGGYCVFDMQFVEFGQAPATGTRSSPAGVYYAAQDLGTTTQTGLAAGIDAIDSGAAIATSGNVA